MNANHRHSPQNILSFFLTFVFFLIIHIHPNHCAAQEPLRIHFIDVGYGDAIFIEFPDSTTMMIDSGGKLYAPELISYLQSQSVRTIDTAIITHPHVNHFEGFFAILSHIPIKRVFVNGNEKGEEGYLDLLEAFERKNIPIRTLRRGQALDDLSTDIEMNVLQPNSLSDSPNDDSIVLHLKYKEVEVLLMADVEVKGQEELFAFDDDLDRVDCIKVPHHGGPLSNDFVQIFKDKIFIISTSANQWGWPREEDLKKLNGKIYRTDQHGTVVLETDGHVIRMSP